MPRKTSKPERERKAKYRRARIRNFVFTHGPNRLSRGRIGHHHLRSEIVLRQIEIASPDWPSAFDGLSIGHVSDFHLGDLIPLDRALAAVALLAEQDPDLVACTGDVVDLNHDPAPPLLAALADIGAPLGTFLVLGNHDELHCRDTMLRLAGEVGITALHDEAASVAHGGERLTIAGIQWGKSAVDCARSIDRTCGDATDLLLSHNPRAFLRAAEIGIPLTLSGHTHGGQVALRRRPNANLALTHRHSAGLFASGHSRLYVTTGVGSWFPLRVNCPPEVVVVTMRREG